MDAHLQRHVPGTRGIEYWCVEASTHDQPSFHVQDVASEVGNSRRWIPAPVRNSGIVSWVCKSVPIPRGGMVVVNWTHESMGWIRAPDSEYRAVAATAPQSLPGLKLCDDPETALTDGVSLPTHPFLGQDLRCVGTIPGKVRFGEIVQVTGADLAGLQVITTGRKVPVSFVLSPKEVASVCRPARLATLRELLNSHYSKRPVVVVMSHTSSRGPAFRQEWDPLYVSLTLAGSKNWTIVANDSGLQAATRRMQDVLRREPVVVPPVWTRFVLATQKK